MKRKGRTGAQAAHTERGEDLAAPIIAAIKDARTQDHVEGLVAGLRAVHSEGAATRIQLATGLSAAARASVGSNIAYEAHDAAGWKGWEREGYAAYAGRALPWLDACLAELRSMCVSVDEPLPFARELARALAGSVAGTSGGLPFRPRRLRRKAPSRRSLRDLEDLRALVRVYPGDRAILSALRDAASRYSYPGPDTIGQIVLGDLRDLLRADPENTAARDALRTTLMQRATMSDRSALAELRALYEARPDDCAVAGDLAVAECASAPREDEPASRAAVAALKQLYSRHGCVALYRAATLQQLAAIYIGESRFLEVGELLDRLRECAAENPGGAAATPLAATIHLLVIAYEALGWSRDAEPLRAELAGLVRTNPRAHRLKVYRLEALSDAVLAGARRRDLETMNAVVAQARRIVARAQMPRHGDLVPPFANCLSAAALAHRRAGNWRRSERLIEEIRTLYRRHNPYGVDTILAACVSRLAHDQARAGDLDGLRHTLEELRAMHAEERASWRDYDDGPPPPAASGARLDAVLRRLTFAPRSDEFIVREQWTFGDTPLADALEDAAIACRDAGLQEEARSHLREAAATYHRGRAARMIALSRARKPSTPSGR